MQIRNTKKSAKSLARILIKQKLVPVFDLDGVLIDASHRQNCNPDGSLNLKAYRKNSTAEKIALDKTLPLIEAINILNAEKIKYHVCTARVACEFTRKLLADNNINPVSIMARNGDNDTRRDYELKSSHLLKFGFRERRNMVLIDDNQANCKAARDCDLQSVHVPFDGH